MNDGLMHYEGALRLSAFFGVFALMALLEALFPKRPRSVSKARRWTANLGVTFSGALLVRVLFPAGATGFALWAEARQWGLLPLLNLPGWADGIIAFLVLDFTIYMQHMVFHHLPALWRLHMMHHTDLDLDVTSGARFHPVEILISMGIKIAVIFFLGAPAAAVLVFEVVLNAAAMFNHANLSLPPLADRVLRWFIVTPDMHRVHHSVIIREFNSNFGFNLPWWDRLLGTYRARPVKGHSGMTLGLARFRDFGELGFFGLLILPFGKKTQKNA